MFRLFRRRKHPESHAPQIREAVARAAELERRAQRVVPELTARRNRNHWGEAVSMIVRKG